MNYNIPSKFIKLFKQTNNNYIYIQLYQPVFGGMSIEDSKNYYAGFAVLIKDPNIYSVTIFQLIEKEISFYITDRQATFTNNFHSWQVGNAEVHMPGGESMLGATIQETIPEKNITITVDAKNNEITYIKDLTTNKIYTIKQLSFDAYQFGILYKMPYIEGHNYLMY